MRHERHWRGTPVLEEVVIRFLADDNSRTLALQNGEVDMIFGVKDPVWLETVRALGLIVDGWGAGNTQRVLFYNMTREPLDDIRVRQALSYALGHETLEEYYGTLASPMYTHLPPTVAGSLTKDELPPELWFQRDTAKAVDLLTQAGYPNGFELHMQLTELEAYRKPMEIIQEVWRQIGVDLQFTMVDHSTYGSEIRQDANDIVIYGGSRGPSPDPWLTQFYHSESVVTKPTAVTNFSHYGDVDADGDGTIDSIDFYIEEGRKTVDEDARNALYRDAQIQLLEDLPAFPLCAMQGTLARQPYVDLGYEYFATHMEWYPITEATVILKH